MKKVQGTGHREQETEERRKKEKVVTQAPPPLNLKLKLPDSSARCQGMVSNTTQCQRGLNCTQHREVNERFYRQGQRKASQAPGMFRSQNAWYRAASVWWSELDAEENGEHAGETPNSKGKKKMHNIISVGTPKRQQQPFLEEQAAADALLGLVWKSPNGQMAASRLCRKLYEQCASARSLIARHGGLKNWIASPMLANVVQWVDNGVPDQGCGYVTLKEQGGAAGLASYRDDSRQECFGGSSSRPLHKQRPLSHEPAGPEKVTPAKQPEATVAIFVDAENLGHYLKRHSGAQRLVQEAKQYGSPIVRKAFGDWSQPGVNAHQALLVENGFQLVHTPHPVSGKAAADIAMVVDVMSTLHSMPMLSCFVLATGDSDFSHVFSHLKKEGCTVVGVGPRSVLSRIVTNTVDKFVFTDEGTGAHHQRTGKQRRKRASVENRALKVKPCGVKKAKSAQSKKRSGSSSSYSTDEWQRRGRQKCPDGSRAPCQEAKKIVRKRTQGAGPRRRREQLKDGVLKAKTNGVKKAKECEYFSDDD